MGASRISVKQDALLQTVNKTRSAAILHDPRSASLSGAKVATI